VVRRFFTDHYVFSPKLIDYIDQQIHFVQDFWVSPSGSYLLTFDNLRRSVGLKYLINSIEHPEILKFLMGSNFQEKREKITLIPTSAIVSDQSDPTTALPSQLNTSRSNKKTNKLKELIEADQKHSSF